MARTPRVLFLHLLCACDFAVAPAPVCPVQGHGFVDGQDEEQAHSAAQMQSADQALPLQQCRSQNRLNGKRSFLQTGTQMQRPDSSVVSGYKTPQQQPTSASPEVRLDQLGANETMARATGALNWTHTDQHTNSRAHAHHHQHAKSRRPTSNLQLLRLEVIKTVRRLERGYLSLLDLNASNMRSSSLTSLSTGGIAVFLMAALCVCGCLFYAVRHVQQADSSFEEIEKNRRGFQPSQRGADGQSRQGRFPISAPCFPRYTPSQDRRPQPPSQGILPSERAGLPTSSGVPSLIPKIQGALPTGVLAPVSRSLCPGLVVPRGNECLLAVPTLESMGLPPRNSASFSVKDLNGKPVIDCEVAKPDWFGASRTRIVTLRAAAAEGSQASDLLAYCTVGKESTSRRSTYICDANGELFAHIWKDPFKPCYVLTSGKIGLQLTFDGNFDEHAVSITNEAREQLADTEPAQMSFDPNGKYYSLRVISNVDVGIMLCGLLAIDHMEAS